jgi:hypothetical protein
MPWIFSPYKGTNKTNIELANIPICKGIPRFVPREITWIASPIREIEISIDTFLRTSD